MKFRVNPREVVLDFIPRGTVGAEIGVHLGDYSNKIVSVVEPRRLYLIDPWHAFDDQKYSKSWYFSKTSPQSEMDARYKSVVKRFAGKPEVEVIREFSATAASQFEPDSLDWVYIDGDHSYEGCKADIAAYGSKVKKGGLLIGDDYALGQWWGRGVIDAFHEALASKDYVIALKIGTQIVLRRIA